MNDSLLDQAWREFHVSRASRDRYDFDQALFATNGNVIFANFSAARLFAAKINAKRDLTRNPEQAVKAGQINAVGLLDEVLHYVAARYREEKNPRALAKALEWLDAKIGRDAVDTALLRFTEDFPPVAVYQAQSSAIEYLQGKTQGISNRHIALEEMLMLWLSNTNPALKPFNELFDDKSLSDTAYRPVMTQLREFFDTQPRFGPNNQNLIDMLRAPALTHPDSVTAQLEWLLRSWSELGEEFFQRLLSSLDFIKEEEKPVFFGPGPSIVPTYERGAGARGGATVGLDEPERFSPDLAWMPRVVLLAKNAYVWLDQLSKQYGREIRRLDQVPDEELDMLAQRGFTGLWLIGLWERSRASQRIKQMCGNPDAVASAYSLYAYDIAHALGGEAAMHDLRERAGQRGIRMASDMVPNHMAIDSRWVVEHPNWFLSLPHSPFPTYTFGGVNLSTDDRVGIYLEDHYYSKSDAAVVFKRVDHWTGEERYVYHGNDGTSTPWNDTAQLDYLQAEVREAVIQTILHVARQFPIIRFDAAMTLAKRHYQRLWFPEPGTGGDIASRAEHGLTAEQFNAVFPEEFWREVVERVAQEVPETLLLAEAFWMMEGYFVRTLGMHRVYNSAFMNMLRAEENVKYRTVLKNTLQFEPEILKRFVNFMSNPDEDTSVEQFGKGDKYFGICTLMATLPGLPMFGHGQVEGYAEKYGMEYPRAYWDEKPDEYLVQRHQREIFPLLHRRHIFAEVSDFALYDFWTSDGSVNEDVYAYSNRSGDERALVIYNNKYADAAGWVRSSVGVLDKASGGIQQRVLGESLGLSEDAEFFTIFRDNTSGLEYIRNNTELCERGLFAQLRPYEYHVFLDFREVRDTTGRYAQVATMLNGRGVPSVDRAVRELWVQPVLVPFRDVADAELWKQLLGIEPEIAIPAEENVATIESFVDVPLPAANGVSPQTETAEVEDAAATDSTVTPAQSFVPFTLNTEALQELQKRLRVLAAAVHSFSAQQNGTAHESETADYLESVQTRLQTLSQLPSLVTGTTQTYLASQWKSPQTIATLLGWILVHDLARVTSEHNMDARSRSWLDEWLLADALQDTYHALGFDEYSAQRIASLIKILTANSRGFAANDGASLFEFVTLLISDADAKQFIGVNRYDNVLWFNKEGWDELLWWLFATTAINGTDEDTLQRHYTTVTQLQKVAEESGYQVVKMLNHVRQLAARSRRQKVM